MSPRSVLRYVRWHLALNTEPDAEPLTYAMECTMCGERGPASEDAKAARAWVFEHVKAPENRLHMTYREHITRPWTAMPGPPAPASSPATPPLSAAPTETS